MLELISTLATASQAILNWLDYSKRQSKIKNRSQAKVRTSQTAPSKHAINLSENLGRVYYDERRDAILNRARNFAKDSVNNIESFNNEVFPLLVMALLAFIGLFVLRIFLYILGINQSQFETLLLKIVISTLVVLFLFIIGNNIRLLMIFSTNFREELKLSKLDRRALLQLRDNMEEDFLSCYQKNLLMYAIEDELVEVTYRKKLIRLAQILLSNG